MTAIEVDEEPDVQELSMAGWHVWSCGRPGVTLEVHRIDDRVTVGLSEWYGGSRRASTDLVLAPDGSVVGTHIGSPSTLCARDDHISVVPGDGRRSKAALAPGELLVQVTVGMLESLPPERLASLGAALRTASPRDVVDELVRSVPEWTAGVVVLQRSRVQESE